MGNGSVGSVGIMDIVGVCLPEAGRGESIFKSGVGRGAEQEEERRGAEHSPILLSPVSCLLSPVPLFPSRMYF